MTSQLTRRELTILRIVARGASNQQIAGFLGISEHTVANHIHSILEKLNVKSRFEAVDVGLGVSMASEHNCDGCPLAAQVAMIAGELMRLTNKARGPQRLGNKEIVEHVDGEYGGTNH